MVRNLLIQVLKLEQVLERKHQKEQFKKQQDEITGTASNELNKLNYFKEIP